MAVNEEALRRVLQERNFFALAQISYRRQWELEEAAAEEDEPEEPAVRKKRKRALRLTKREKQEAAILHDKPPYPEIAKELMWRVVYSAERWEQMTDPYVAESRPLLRYEAEGCPHPEHMEKNWLIYPIDHPFWEEWVPPNGFPCWCSVGSVSPSLLERGLAKDGEWRWRTGVPLESLHYPYPDDGFAFNPGRLLQPPPRLQVPGPRLQVPEPRLQVPAAKTGVLSRIKEWWS